MKKVSKAAIAALAFFFAVIGQPLALALAIGYALVAAKDEWLSKQVIQAGLVWGVYHLVLIVFNVFFGIFDQIFDWADAYKAITVFNDIHTVVDDLLLIVFVVVCAVSIIKVAGGKDANLPLLSKIAEGKADNTDENNQDGEN